MSAPSYTSPLLDGFPTLPALLDSSANTYPHRTYLQFTDDATPESVVKITHLEYNRASHRAAEALSKLPGYDGAVREVVAVLATADTLVYATIFVGALRAGFVPFFISPAIAPTGIISLMQKTNCTRILTSPPLKDTLVSPLLDAFPEERKPKVDLIPGVETLFPHLGTETSDHPFHPFTQNIVDAKVDSDEVYLYLHSSGSTGIPKPIPHTRRSFISWGDRDYIRLWAKEAVPPRIGSMVVPLFNTLGIAATIITPLMCGAIAVIYPPIVRGSQALPYAPTPSSILEHARRGGCHGVVVPPVLIHAWAQSPDALGYLKTLRFLFYAGSSLLPKIGEFVAKQGVPLVCSYGLTEAGCVSDLGVIPRDVDKAWQYMRLDAGMNLSWKDQGDGTFELLILAGDCHRPAVLNNSDSEPAGYATSDIFTPHPTEPNLWRLVGRLNNIIILANGYKVAPGVMEDIIVAHPLVQGAVIFGKNRQATGVLIEPVADAFNPAKAGEQDIAEFKAKIWPTIVEANEQVQTHVQVSKELVIVAIPDRPLPRASKGTVMTEPALKLYETEIDQLYQNAENGLP